MRDLSIRGAGNLLGSSQSGFIDSVGFDLYSQMLSEAVLKKQGKAVPTMEDSVEIDLQVDAYIPATYIQDERQKIEIYKRIREIQIQEDYELLQDELIDRFGEYLYIKKRGANTSEDFNIVNRIEKRYDLNILYDNKSYGVEITDGRYSFSTRNRYIKIIDHLYIGGLLGLRPPSFNYKFNYVKKIGVCLPSLIYGDMSEEYPADDLWLFTVRDNEFYCRFRGHNPPAQEILHSKFQMYHKQIENFSFGASDCLIVDLSELF